MAERIRLRYPLRTRSTSELSTSCTRVVEKLTQEPRSGPISANLGDRVAKTSPKMARCRPKSVNRGIWSTLAKLDQLLLVFGEI